MSPRSVPVSLAAALALSLAAGSASAQTSGGPSAVMGGHVHDWVIGERNESVVFLGLGLTSLGGGVLLASRDSDFARGAGITYAVMGVLLTLGAGAYAAPLPQLEADLLADLERDPVAFKAVETARMEGIADRFVLYRYTEMAVGAVGVGLVIGGAAAEEDMVAGVGLGLASEAALLLLLDAFAERRTHDYLAELRAFRPQPVASVTSDGGMIGVTGAF
jgi:hypothetical protein